MTTRRQFLLSIAGGAGALAVGARAAHALQGTAVASTVPDTAFMPGMAGVAKPVRLPPKPGARPSMTADERDALEHRLHCQCGTCTLDIYTCRTTDFRCQISPAMHRDVVALVQGGYEAQEILDAFVGVYGEKVLMAPERSGFNLVAWITPGVAFLAGGAFVIWVVRRWAAARGAAGEPRLAPVGFSSSSDLGIGATPAELERLQAAVRSDRGA